MNKRPIGSNFDDFLAQELLLAKCEAGALKRVVIWQLAQEMCPAQRDQPQPDRVPKPHEPFHLSPPSPRSAQSRQDSGVPVRQELLARSSLPK